MQKIKKHIAFFTAILFVIFLCLPTFSFAGDNPGLTDEEINNLAFSAYLKGKLVNFSMDEIKSLLDLIEKIDEQNIIVGNLFKDNNSFSQRLISKGVTKEKVENSVKDYKNTIVDNKNWKTILYEIAETVKTSNNTALQPYQIGWIKKVDNEVFDANFPQVTQLILDKFNSKADFIRFLRIVFDDVVTKNIEIDYTSGNFVLKFNDNFGSSLNNYLKNEVDKVKVLFKKGKSIAPLSDNEIKGLKDIINYIATQINTNTAFTKTDKDLIATALEKVGFTVNKPSSDSGTISDTGSGGAAPTPKYETKTSDNKVEFKVNINMAKVTEQQGKAVITFDQSTVNEIIKAFEETASKASGKELVLILNFASEDIKSENIEANIPNEIFAKACDKGAKVVINLNDLSLDIPKDAVDIKTGSIVKLEIKSDDVSNVLNNFKNVKLIGKAKDIMFKVDEKAAQFKNKITLRFSIKGLTANIDKLGLYFVDKEKGSVEFVGGKVDKSNGEILAKVSHFSTYAVLEYNKTFEDITNHWAKNYIESLASKHIVNGKNDKNFDPNGKITRAEFVKMIVKALEIDINKYKGTFSDVKADAWYADYIQTAYDNGIVKGKVEGKIFDPKGLITREEIFTIIARAMKVKPSKDVQTILSNFKDYKDISGYALEHTAGLVEQKIVSGYSDNTIKPKANATRAEAAKLIYEIYNR